MIDWRASSAAFNLAVAEAIASIGNEHLRTLRKTWHEAIRARTRTHQIPRESWLKRARLRLSGIFSCLLTSKNLEPSGYKHVVLGLIFLRHISLAFEARHEALLREDPLAAEDRDEYTGENIFCGAERGALVPSSSQCSAAYHWQVD